ncbi:Nicotinamidase-related amidase [Cupriavidus necator]|uniref:Amidase related to nicotinamidase,Isochorismatase family n=1 Tax=Cupriavidus necator (strain ATCC 17699 / DSM 428 / KCTC 22496 / NCIMB 10442 / H16 / Stanier 337) TaxID=381666 RepID=Q0K8T7_CUPNH|nr:MULTISPECIES: cysteine hydrolase family protein [Cupriavidus]EON16537.1 amidase [Cupriavidus sp. GA3-3]QCC01373.1 cysteine hydrolase [Cupriavidus necator H16]QQB75797.1 cysteine hydrolase [Cupriavidus necator]WKA39761.1 cysteine hydrolase family protein [Cupriavidus necator]CAJ93584.1 amidase related to nicotinamidase,Isochorismatase family [Cupriavidus necator H16]
MTTPTTLLDLAGASRTPSAWEAAVLILIDHQREYVDGRLPLAGMPAAVAACAQLLALARRHGTPVIHVAHHGRPGSMAFDPTGPYAAFIEGVGPQAGEITVTKGLPNSFAGTTLADELARLGRKELIVAGFQTHMCVSATVRSALDHGYRSTVVAAACATRDLPDPLGGPAVPAADLHRSTLAALNDRFATVVADAGAWHG